MYEKYFLYAREYYHFGKSITFAIFYAMKKQLYIMLLFALPTLSWGQGIKCNFTLNAAKVQNAGDAAYTSMKTTIAEFLNTTTWLEHNVQPFEQIECNIILTINAQTAENEYNGTLQIQAQRPIYNSTYNSVTLNAIDNDVEFRYSPNEPLDFSMMSHNPNNLTPLLAFWLYIVIGWDADTYAPLGGSDMLRNAERIVQNAQSETKAGWNTSSGSGRKNRYWLIENLMGKRYEKLRQANYLYHRRGLDMLADNLIQGRKNVQTALQDMQNLYTEKPDITLYPIALFFDAKADEIVNIFSEVSPEEKDKLYTMLTKTNIVNEPKYKRLKQ
jgi:hypothetical protein